MLWEV
jgi:Zn/Cd-binding protein ZinT